MSFHSLRTIDHDIYRHHAAAGPAHWQYCTTTDISTLNPRCMNYLGISVSFGTPLTVKSFYSTTASYKTSLNRSLHTMGIGSANLNRTLATTEILSIYHPDSSEFIISRNLKFCRGDPRREISKSQLIRASSSSQFIISWNFCGGNPQREVP